MLGWQQERTMYRKDIGRIYGRIRNHKRQVKQIPAFLDKEYLGQTGRRADVFFRSQGELCIPLQALPGIQKNP